MKKISNKSFLDIFTTKYIVEDKPIKLKEKVKGTREAIINILNKSKNEELNNVLNEVLNTYVTLSLHNYYYGDVLDLTNIPSEICKELKLISIKLDLNDKNQLEAKKSEAREKNKQEVENFLEDLRKF